MTKNFTRCECGHFHMESFEKDGFHSMCLTCGCKKYPDLSDEENIKLRATSKDFLNESIS